MTKQQFLRKIIEKYNLSLAQVGDMCCISKNCVAQYMYGKRNPKIETLEKLMSNLKKYVDDASYNIKLDIVEFKQLKKELTNNEQISKQGKFKSRNDN